MKKAIVTMAVIFMAATAHSFDSDGIQLEMMLQRHAAVARANQARQDQISDTLVRGLQETIREMNRSHDILMHDISMSRQRSHELELLLNSSRGWNE